MFGIGSGWLSAVGVGCELLGFVLVALEYIRGSYSSSREAESSRKRAPTPEGDWHPECITSAFLPLPEVQFSGPADEARAGAERMKSREMGIEALTRTSYFVLRQAHLTRSVDAPKSIRDLAARRWLFVLGAAFVLLGGLLQIVGSLPAASEPILAPAMFSVNADRPVSVTVEQSGAVSIVWSDPGD